jgi:hypothetical protein
MTQRVSPDDTLKAVTAAKTHYCIIKRNKRLESDEKWLEIAQQQGKRIETRKGKKTWIGTVGRHPERKEQTLEDVNIVFEVTERETDAQGNPLLFAEIEVNSWWTNLECEVEKVIELYHDHATSEQFHAELKSDMDVEVIRDLICVAGKLVKHGRALIFKINEKDPVLQVFQRLNAALDCP